MNNSKSLYEQYKNCSPKELNSHFVKACENGKLELVKYLLTSPELKEHANIHTDKVTGFKMACRFGHLEVVKYLLTYDELNEQPYSNSSQNEGFITASVNEHLDVVKYLLTSPDLIKHAHIHTKQDLAFCLACDKNNTKLIEYFIFDFNIEKTEDIKRFFKKNPNKEIETMFKTRDLYNQLEKDMPSDKDHKKVIKV